MFDFASKISVLEAVERPQDLAESEVLRHEPIPLNIESSSAELGKQPLSSAGAIYKIPKPVKKHIKNMWDVDIKHSGPGYFDQSGNFILDKPRKSVTSWITKKNDKIEGPFTDREIKELLEQSRVDHDGLVGVYIKRDFDKGFVSLEKLLFDIPDIFDSKDLNRYFSQNQVVESSSRADDFFEASIVNEKNSRLSNFMRNHEISASVDFIIKTIKDLKKSQAVDAVQGITGLDKTVNTALVDLIAENAGYQILSDVDKDGFYINNDDKKRRGYY